MKSPRTRAHGALFLGTVIMLGWGLGGCLEPFSNEALRARRALPGPATLQVLLPSPAPVVAMPVEPREGPARFYLDMLRAAENINSGLFGILAIVDEVTKEPPSFQEEDRFVWGPINPDNGPYELLLTMDHIRTATVGKPTSASSELRLDERFSFWLSARRAGDENMEPFPLFGGWTAPANEAYGQPGVGAFTVLFETIRLIDPSSDSRGTYYCAYDSRDDQIIVEVAADTDATLTQLFDEVNAAYTYQIDNREGCGDFRFFLKSEDTDLVPGPVGPEQMFIASRWVIDGPGRADIAFTQGDLPADAPVLASECWAPSFERVYLRSNIPNSPAFAATGTITDCHSKLRYDIFEQ